MVSLGEIGRFIRRLTLPIRDGRDRREELSTASANEAANLSAPDAILAGTMAGTRYKIRRRLSRGGMGAVYLADDQHLDIALILKFILPEYIFDPDFDNRFKREARALARVNHHNVVRIYDYGKFDGQAFIAMAYVKGKSLRDIMQEQGPFAVAQVLDIGMQICAGLSKVHQAGLIHRDIKPSNLLMDKKGRITIIDFGIAKVEGTAQFTQAGIMVGSRPYMSPEQVRGEKLDLRLDIFSLGIVLYELLAGRQPFQGQYEQALYQAILYRMPDALAKYNPGVTVGLQRVIDKALVKDPGERYQSAEEMWQDLREEREHPTAIAAPPAVSTTLELTHFQTSGGDFGIPPALGRATLESPEGIMAPESRFYIEREGDRALAEEAGRQGVTLIILGPQKIGKSCLLARLRLFANRLHKRFAWINFRQVDQEALCAEEVFYRRFCALMAEALEMEERLDEHWKPDLANNDRCSRYMNRYILKTLQKPLVLALDDVDRLFDAPFRDNFFGMLRSWHSSRAIEPVWKQLDLVLVTSAEPNRFIKNPRQSPFNVGRQIELADFTSEQVTALNRLHDSPLDKKHEERLFDFIGGHPYLVRVALYQVASGNYEAAQLFAKAGDEAGPFGQHLQYLAAQLSDQPELTGALKTILRQQVCGDDALYYRLHALGLVRRKDKLVAPRCKLYGAYFQEHLDA